jgi:hypothetical protein
MTWALIPDRIWNGVSEISEEGMAVLIRGELIEAIVAVEQV